MTIASATRYLTRHAGDVTTSQVWAIRAYVNERRGGRKLQAYRIAGQRALRFKVEDLDALMEPVNPEQEQMDTP